MEWNVAEDVVNQLKKQGGFDLLRKKLSRLCEQRDCLRDAKRGMKHMFQEEYETMLKKSKGHPALLIKMSNKRVFGEDLSVAIETRFPWDILKEDVIRILLSSTDFREELDDFIDASLTSIIEGVKTSKEAMGGTPSSRHSKTHLGNNSGSSRKLLKTESLLEELLGAIDIEKNSLAKESTKLELTTTDTTKSTREAHANPIPAEEDVLIVSDDLEEGEVISEFAWLSDSKRLVFDKTMDRIAIGKVVAANISMHSDRPKWIYGRITGINADKVRIIAISLDDKRPQWSMKEWLVTRDNIVFLPEATDFQAISIHLSRLKRAQSANELLMAINMDDDDEDDAIGHVFRPVQLFFPSEDGKKTGDTILTAELLIEKDKSFLVPVNHCMTLL